MLFKASAPGSVMLLGEYAVLHGHSALVAAVDRRMTVTITPHKALDIVISSSLGEHKTSPSSLEVVPPFQFVLAVLKKYQTHLPSGCHLAIEAGFSSQMGFASSAAVTVATLMAVSQWLNFSFSEKELIQAGCQIIRSVQGLGSGADIAACVMGSIVAYCREPFWVEKFHHSPPFSVVYSGYKTPTVEAVTWVENYFSAYPDLYQHLLHSIATCVQHGISAVRQQDWQALGKIMNVQQGLMDALGVNTKELQKCVNDLRLQSGMLGAKISGSGLGDCAIGIGVENDSSMKISARGVQCEKT